MPTDPIDQVPCSDPIAAAEEAVEAARIRFERLEPRLRRFGRALFDLGLLDIVGPGWARIADDDQAFEFRPLSARAFDRLVGTLEVRAEGRPIPAPTAADASQQRLDLTQVAGPAQHPVSVSAFHPALPR